MKVIYSSDHLAHDPQVFIVRGRMKRSNEQPERGERLLAAARSDGHEVVPAADYGAGPRAAIHTPEYLHFLETAHARWQELPDASEEVLPNVHPFPGQPCTYPSSIVAQAGYHMGDGACSIGPNTWRAIVGATNSAVHAAELVLAGEHATYALCRPPGHHAYSDRANGFCYLNNTAIAAQHLLRAYDRVAIVDIDMHHGNGTQGIFYHRRDVLTISLHADPNLFFPYYTGFAYERGEGDGLGYNINVPLQKGTADDAYMASLRRTLTVLRGFVPGAIVVALGLDAHENDPYQALAISTGGFARITAEIARLGLPTVMVQEGGYLSEDLGPSLSSALRGFLGAC